MKKPKAKDATSSRRHEEAAELDKFTVSHGGPGSAGTGEAEEVVGHASNGRDLVPPESPNCFAKSVKSPDTGTTRYFVKYSTSGHTAGSMANPAEDGDPGRRGDWTANGRFQFRAVSKEAFDTYLKFLATGNPAHLRVAARLVGG